MPLPAGLLLPRSQTSATLPGVLLASQTTVGSISKLPLSHSGTHHFYSEFIKVRKGGGLGVIGMLYWGVMSSLLLIIINSLKIRLLMISTQKRGAGLSQEQHNYLLMRCKFPKEVTETYRIHLLN